MDGPQPYPVRIEGQLDSELSRWLWLVKWILAIPHYIVLALLWLTLLVLTIVAFFAILFTGRYPRGIFDFNVGVLRWTWRVAFYSYGALGTDRYPPFTLDDVPDYPARLEVAYPEQLSRGLVLVKWWLLAIPQYIVTGIFLGGGSYAAAQVDDWFWGIGFETGLIGILVLFAGVALLFTTRYPGGLFDFAVGLDRWVARVAAYVLLMRDEYPPFRLDQGGTEAEGVRGAGFRVPCRLRRRRAGCAGRASCRERLDRWTNRARGRRHHRGPARARAPRSAAARSSPSIRHNETTTGSSCHRRRTSRHRRTRSCPRAPTSTPREPSGRSTRSSARSGFAARATARCSSGSGRPARSRGTSEASSATWSTTSTASGDPEYSRRSGGAPSGPPGDETFWVASTAGAGERTLEWEPEDGDWRAVVMNEDASRGVSAELSIGAELDSILWIGIGLLVAGALFAAGSALAITAATRRRR